jgi:galactose oxidase-like protein/Big-like domain-containing protein
MFDRISSRRQKRCTAPSIHSWPKSRMRDAGRFMRQGLPWVALMLVGLGSACPCANAQDPAVVGQFSPLTSWPSNAVHAVLLPSGKVLWWASYGAGDNPRIWDPISNTHTAVTRAGYNIFCAGHSILGNGQVLVTGGTAAVPPSGVANASIYDPVSGNWTFLPNMNAGRFYPTNTALPNGDVLVLGGDISPQLGTDPLPQVWQASSGTWRDLSTAQLLLPTYPKMHLAPNGNVFYAGPGPISRYINTAGTGSWSTGPTIQFGVRDYGPSVMYDNGKIILVGGGSPPTATAETINLNDPIPTWRYTGTMANARRQANGTLLPDGTVFVTGGSSGAAFDDQTLPVFPTELWNPATGTWSTMASLTTYRGYHSVALLLPDGRVLSAGGQCSVTGCNPYSAEIFSPPYLFKGPRPTIVSAPTTIPGGQTFFVGTPDAANVTQVTWIRLGAVTHTFNQEQRISFLSFSQTTGGLNVTAPPSANLAPAGFYMLSLLNSSGVPSVASIIQVDNSSFLTNAPAVSVSQTSVPFGTWQVGITAPSKVVQLTNLGTTPVTIDSITTGIDFKVTSTTCTSQLAPGSCTINVAFRPTAGGQLNEFLTISDSDSSGPQTVALSGIGKALVAAPPGVNFGKYQIGATSTTIPVTLTNLGPAPINVTSINYSSAEFGQSLPSSTCGPSISGLSSCQVFSTFTPGAAGARNGSFSVSDSDPSSPTTVTLMGVGLALKFSSGSLHFQNTNIPKTSNSMTLTVTNVGPATVNFSTLALGGANSGDFAIQTNTCGAALGAGTNCAVGLTFTPQAAGTRSAVLAFTDDGGGSPQLVLLAGIGQVVLSSVAVTPAQASVSIGGAQQFTATGAYSDGTSKDVTTLATWSSSNTGVVTISNTSGSQGLATGAASGTSTISATLNSVKGSITLTVQNKTTTAVGSNNNPSGFGQSASFSATISPSTATGTVQFLDGGNLIGTGAVSAGTASFATSSLAVGAHSITAAYGGDTNDAVSTSSAITQTVNQVTTSTALSVDINPALAGQTVTFTAMVSPSAATGSVQFVDSFNGTQSVLGTVPLSTGTAVLPTVLPSGPHSITAVYGGDTNDTSSTSAALVETVN